MTPVPSGRHPGLSYVSLTPLVSLAVTDFYFEHYGYCPVCVSPTRFIARHPWFRDHYCCEKCGSIPRQRAVMLVLEGLYPNWSQLDIHESSPAGPVSERIARDCPK